MMAGVSSIWQEDVSIKIMEKIVQKISIGDYIRMGAVCKSWRRIIANVKPSHDVQVPWLLQLKDCKYNHDTGFNFYSLSEGVFYSFKLPNHILNKYPKAAAHEGDTFCCATCDGWLVLVVGPDHDPDMFLFDPISEKDVKLPSLTTLASFPSFLDFVNLDDDDFKISLMVPTVQVFSTSDNNLIVAAIFMDVENEVDILGLCNCDINGVLEEERCWKIFDGGRIDGGRIVRYESMLFHNDALYALIELEDNDCFDLDKRIGDEINRVVVLDERTEVKVKLINIVKDTTAYHIRGANYSNEVHHISYCGLKYVYLTRSIKGELLIIWNKTDPLSKHEEEDIYHTSKLMIERYEGVCKTNEDFEPITSLGDQAVFVSPNSSSFSIPATSGCQSNCIYFTVDMLDTLYKKSLILYRQSDLDGTHISSLSSH
ncbi:hypothetical protein HAX54_045280 [Datura stramonium]|uniref:F-box domain-containing protein n=1 Tax=Datura stramonium TaxID=4076 RepID=A0ABS8RHA1_DATST|nr:hypothetical protein [Datura stramonium]